MVINMHLIKINVKWYDKKKGKTNVIKHFDFDMIVLNFESWKILNTAREVNFAVLWEYKIFSFVWLGSIVNTYSIRKSHTCDCSFVSWSVWVLKNEQSRLVLQEGVYLFDYTK